MDRGTKGIGLDAPALDLYIQSSSALFYSQRFLVYFHSTKEFFIVRCKYVFIIKASHIYLANN